MTSSGESPSLLLQRAADRLEQLESRAVIGPWSTCGPDVTGGPDEEWDVATATTSTTALWIATMNPAVAVPLVAWLRQLAVTVSWAGHLNEVTSSPAFDFARQILGLRAKDEESP